MSPLCLVFYLFFLNYSHGSETPLKLRFEKDAVVPDVIDVAPSEVLQVDYPSGVKVELGNELTPTEVKDIPSVDWNADATCHYTLLMTDPDAPASFKEFRHWLIVNIPGKDIAKGKIIYDYIGSGPPKGTGLHRYIFLVFKQSTIIENNTFVPNTSREGRPKTKARDFIKEYNLGVPVAGNYFRAQFDDYVPILHAQLGGAPKID